MNDIHMGFYDDPNPFYVQKVTVFEPIKLSKRNLVKRVTRF